MKILLATVTSSAKPYTQLGLYNLKAFIDNHANFKEQIKVKIQVERPRKFLPMNKVYGDQFDADKFASKLLKERADLIGFSCFVWNIKIILYAAKKIKTASPKTIIVFGGPEVSHRAKDFINEFYYVDYIVKNDGEQSFFDLVGSLIDKKDQDSIKGICFKKNNEVRDTLYKPADLTKISSPYIAGLISLKNRKTRAIIETTRGCPYRCAYCTYYLANSKVSLFPLNKVKEEIKYILGKRVEKMGITDDNFNLYEKRANEILKTIIKYNRTTKYLPIFLNTYTVRLGKKFIELFRKAGAYGLIGVQTYNKETLSKIKRYSQFKLLEENLKELKDNAIKFNLQFIIGLPGDTYNDIRASVDWAYFFSPDQIVMQELQVFPGTPLYQNADSLGLKFQRDPPYKIIETATLSKNQLAKAKRLAYAVYIFSKRKYLYRTTKWLVNDKKIKFSRICEEWLDYFKFIFNDNRKLYKQSKAFLSFLLEKIKLDNDWKKLDKMIVADIKYYLKYKDYYLFEE